MMIKPSQWWKVLTLLVLVMVTANGQCSAYCSDCVGSSSNGENTNCQDCPDNFNFTSGTGSICTPDTNVYDIVLEDANGDLNLNDSSTSGCGSLYMIDRPGRFSSGRTIRIYTTNSLAGHYQVRMRGTVLFIDNWDSSDKISYMFDSAWKASIRYSSADSVSGSNSCGNNSPKEKYGVLDTGNQPHTSSTLLVEVVADWCKCSGSGGGGGCSTCSWMLPDIILMISLCNQTCQVCFGTSNTQCSSCANDTLMNIQYLLTGSTCDVTCGTGYYKSGPNLCSKCHTNCTVCSGTSSNCSECANNRIFLPLNNTCPSSCPPLYYKNTTTTQCEQCNASCQVCTDNPSPCQYCADTYFLYNSICYDVCPLPDLVQNPDNRTCQNCSTWCVGLTVSFYQPVGTNGFSYLYVDMNFTDTLDFSTFPVSTFQAISFQNSSLDVSMFNVTYTPTNGNRGYRITLQPYGYSLLINQTITVTTMALPSSKHTSALGRLFQDQNYGVSKSLTWTYMRPPDMSNVEVSLVSSFSSFSTEVNNALSKPGLQEIKKLGFMLLLMNSLQITSCLLLVNIILPMNLYEGLRLFASLIFFDVPPWESESTKSKLFMVPPVENLTKRLLQQTGSPMLNEHRFRRVGFTNIFLVDSYIQIGVIVITYLALLIFILLSKTKKCGEKFSPYLKYVYSAQTNLHEIALMYFTLTIMFEFVYFSSTQTVRYISVAICILVSIYYLVYHVHRYHELLKLPLLDPISDEYAALVDKYGSLLKNIRYQESSAYGSCLPFRAYFQPQCYHIVSYIKKLLMMLTFPLFYEQGNIVLGVLTAIQLLEIVRFCVTWPFAKRWRNWLRFALELVLLSVFLIVLAIQLQSVQIFGLNPSADSISLYFNLGWVAFTFVLIFNFGYLVLCIYDLIQGYKFSNREMIDAARRDYYYDKLQKVEIETGEPPLNMLTECVKLGNLNNRFTENLPDVSLRIEMYYITRKTHQNKHIYQVEINNIMEAAMSSTFTFKQNDNNVEVIRKFDGNWRVDRKKHCYCYDIIHKCFERYAKRSTDKITIKTFSEIEQKKYKSGQFIKLSLNRMTQEVEVESDHSEDIEVNKLDKLMDGFPIPQGLLKDLDRGLSVEIPIITEFGARPY